MHPVLARYLDLAAAQDTLRRADAGVALEGDALAFAEAARSAPEQRRAVLAAGASRSSSAEAQQGLLYLAAHAAARALAAEPAFVAPMATARQLLTDEGASPEEADHFLASLVLEEAFGYEDEATHFDAGFFRETLDSVAPLARLTSERVEKLISDHAASAPAGQGATYQAAARAVLDAAWGDGPQPINPEHLEEALATLSRKGNEAERSRRFEALRQFLRFLSAEGMVGPLRSARLEQRALSAALELGIPTGGARAH